MRKSLILTMVMALVLSASMAFAGLSTTPPNSGVVEYGTVDNAAQSDRNCAFTVSAGGESLSQSYLVSGGSSETAYCDDELASMDQQWQVVVSDGSGQEIARATFSYINGQFQPGQIGEGLTFETGDHSFTLTINK